MSSGFILGVSVVSPMGQKRVTVPRQSLPVPAFSSHPATDTFVRFGHGGEDGMDAKKREYFKALRYTLEQKGINPLQGLSIPSKTTWSDFKGIRKHLETLADNYNATVDNANKIDYAYLQDSFGLSRGKQAPGFSVSSDAKAREYLKSLKDALEGKGINPLEGLSNPSNKHWLDVKGVRDHLETVADDYNATVDNASKIDYPWLQDSFGLARSTSVKVIK